MEIALPGLKNEFDLPAKRINFQHGGRLPYCGRHIGDKEVPGQEGQGGLRRRVTFFCLNVKSKCITFNSTSGSVPLCNNT